MVTDSVLSLNKIMGAQPVVDTELFKAMCIARTSFHMYVQHEGADSAVVLTQVAESKSTAMMALDRHWEIEAALISEVTGERAGDRVKVGLVALMPTETTAVTPEELMQRITTFQTTAAVKFAPPGVQAKVAAFLATVSKVVDNRPPRIEEVLTDPLLGGVSQLMRNLLRVQIEDGGQNTTLVGARAVEHLYTQAKDKLAEEKLVVADTVLLEVYGWLLNPEALLEVKSMIKRVYANATMTATRAKTHKS